MRRLILSLLTLALVAIPVSVAWSPPDPGTLAPVNGMRYEFRIYATYEDPLSNSGIFHDGNGWRLVVNGADAGTITLNFGAAQIVTTSTAQDAGLTRLLAKINAERVASAQAPFATIEDWLKATLVGAVQSYREQAARADAEDACVAYNAASAAVQNGIKTALGGKAPCAN